MKQEEYNQLLQQIATNQYTDSKLNIVTTDESESELLIDPIVLGDEETKQLAQALRTNTYVKNLVLYGQNIGDEGAKALAEIDTLKELYLSYNEIKAEGVIALLNTDLEILSLEGNKLCSDDQDSILLEELAYALVNNTTITYLNLSRTFISENIIGKLIKENATIKKLYINDNKLTDKVLTGIKYNTTLDLLNISANNITDIGAKFIAKNSSLTTLRVDKAEITDIGGRILTAHPTLKTLHIRSNKLTPEGLKGFIGTNLDEVHPSNHKIHFAKLMSFERAFNKVVNIRDTSQKNNIPFKLNIPQLDNSSSDDDISDIDLAGDMEIY